MDNTLKAESCIQFVPLFKNLTEEELNEIILISTHQKLEKGAFLFNSGDWLNHLYVIHRGRIKISRISKEGKEQIIRLLGPGDFLGELALFNEEKSSTYASAIEPTIICLVKGTSIRELMTKSPKLSYKMLQELSKRLDKAESLIEERTTLTALQKIAKFLLDNGNEGFVKLKSTKANIANALGMSAETFSRRLKFLQEQRIIKVVNHHLIHIIDFNRLKNEQ